MDTSEIKDEKSLQAWLETRPQADSIAIAHRSALRAISDFFLPSGFMEWDGYNRYAVSLMRCALTSGVATKSTSIEVVSSARAAAEHRIPYAANRLVDKAIRVAGNSCKAVLNDKYRWEYAASAARSSESTDAPNYSATVFRELVWQAINTDMTYLLAGTDPLIFPLWHSGATPPVFISSREAMRTYWQTNTPTHWAFWLRWWDAAIAGRPLDWQLQHDIALIPDDIWQSGPGPVAEAIAKIEAAYNQRPPEHPLTTELRTLPKPSASQITTTQAAMEQNRTMLPPTFDAIEGLILLEIELLRHRNYTDDLDQAEALRQIRIFVTLYDAICALRAQLPATAPVTEEQAEKSVSLVSLYTKKFAELPREKADEVVEGFWSAGRGAVQATLIGTTTLLGVSYGLPALAAVTIGTMVFAPKNAADLVKAAREALTPKP